MGDGLHDGYSLDDLLSIGTRKHKLDLNISATDVNRSLPFEVSKIIQGKIDGLSESELKDIGERKLSLPTMQPSEINEAKIGTPDNMIQNILSGLQKMLGVRTS